MLSTILLAAQIYNGEIVRFIPSSLTQSSELFFIHIATYVVVVNVVDVLEVLQKETDSLFFLLFLTW